MIVKIPVRVYVHFLARVPLASHESAVLKSSILQPTPSGDYNVEVFCEASDAELLLNHAKHFCAEAVPYIEEALNFVHNQE